MFDVQKYKAKEWRKKHGKSLADFICSYNITAGDK